MNPMKKRALIESLQALIEDMDDLDGESYGKGLRKVTVASPDEEGLEEGLEMAQELVSEMPMDEMMDEDEEDEDMLSARKRMLMK